jgi:outer membrane protein assembly factor BamD
MRTLLALLALVSFVAISLPAQEEPLPEPPKAKPQVRRGLPGGFGGLKPAEAKAAQEELEKGKAYEQAGKDSAAIHAYKRVYKKYPRSTSAPEAYYRSAQIFLKQNKLSNAFEAIDVIVRAYPNYGHFNELISEEYKIAYDVLNGKRMKTLGFLPSFSNRDRGLGYFERLVLNAPYSDYAPLALMNVAEAYGRMNETDAAIDALDRLITNYPSSIVASDGYLRLAQIHEKLVDGPLYDQGSTQESIENYEDFLILFPSDPKVGDAEKGLARMKEMLAESRLKIGDFYYKKRARYTAAKVFYNEAITAAPNSAAAQDARKKIAEVEVAEAEADANRAAEAARPARRRFFGIFGAPKEPQAPTPPGVVVPSEPPPAETPPSPPARTVEPAPVPTPPATTP